MSALKIRMVFVIMAIMFAGIGIVALPYAVSLLTGQHTWYDLGGNGSDVPCEKCHADVAEEMQQMKSQMYAPHKTYPCAHCHRVSGFGENNGTGMIYASVNESEITPGKQAHAAMTVECMDCHDLNYMFGRPPPPPPDHHMHNPQYQTCGWGGPPEGGPRNCHAPPRNGDNISQIRAGGFGLTDFDNMSRYYYWKTWPEDTGEKAAHKQFVFDAIENKTMKYANEACVACHTRMRVEIWFNVTTEMNIIVNNSYTSSSSYWNVTKIEPSNYTEYKEVKEG